jgi:hypothetical protein
MRSAIDTRRTCDKTLSADGPPVADIVFDVPTVGD